MELQLYEDLNEKTMSGQIVITDSTGLPNNFPLTGNELLQFKFGTPAQIDITILKSTYGYLQDRQ